VAWFGARKQRRRNEETGPLGDEHMVVTSALTRVLAVNPVQWTRAQMAFTLG
jgi:hypothetical protein